MEVSAINALSRADGVAPIGVARGAGVNAANGFADALGKALASVDGAQQRADALSHRFQLNDPTVTLEETMISLQTANVSFQSLVQVRNRLLSAYHDIMNLQL